MDGMGWDGREWDMMDGWMDGQALVACSHENKQCMIDWNVCASFYRLFCIYFFFSQGA